jgi:hypothetical protein
MPFHLDNGVFRHIAGNAGRQSLMPLGRPIVWEGRVWPNLRVGTIWP